MQLELLTRVLAEHPFVKGMPPAEVEFLSGCTKNVRYSPDEFLFREGAVSTELFLVREGRVALESHDPGRGSAKLETIGPGEVLGWSALFEPHVFHLDARALEPTLVFSIDGRCLNAKMAREPAFGFEVTKRLLYQAHQRLERARLQQLDVYKMELRGPSTSAKGTLGKGAR